MSINVGPRVPTRNRRALPFVARSLLRLFKWEVVGKLPDAPKMILIGAPHSSFKDLFYVLLTVHSLDVKASFLAAVWTFSRLPIGGRSKSDGNVFGMRWPLGWLQEKMMRRLGGIPVDRGRSTGAIDKLIAQIDSMEKMVLMITPEGGTRGSRELKTGFYVISERLNLPIVPIQFDYQLRRFNLMEALYPMGDKEQDIAKIRQMFDGIQGKYRTFKV
jgi:1-acyl-sn-glycerol-3-phosphate acyltransferase